MDLAGKLDTLTLRVTDPEGQYQFYRDVLGMSDQGRGRIGYSDRQVALQFVAADAPYQPQPTDLYWKIALSVPDIELAYKQLNRIGIPCSEPYQFRDVGYLTKFLDPAGFSVELIDHWFKGERPKDTHSNENLFGGGAHLSLVTLRTADISAVEPEILRWGMRPLSVQPVEPSGFTLYFYAFTDEAPPNPDLTAIENRTWVYQRPYTVLELQHVHALEAETSPPVSASGYQDLLITSPDPLSGSERLRIKVSG